MLDTGKLIAEARRLAMPHLREQGIVALSDDAVFTDALGEIVLVAKGTDHAGRLHDVAARVFPSLTLRAKVMGIYRTALRFSGHA